MSWSLVALLILVTRAAAAGPSEHVELYTSVHGGAWSDLLEHNFANVGESFGLRSQGITVSIGHAHSRGLLHRGTWTFISRKGAGGEAEVLLLRRASSTVTCPSSWTLLGEHSEPNERWEETARRGAREELGVELEAVELLGSPLIFLANYSLEGGVRAGLSKVDVQATQLSVGSLGAATTALLRGGVSALRFDADVAEGRWFSLRALQQKLHASPEHFCNESIRRLLRVAIGRLRRHLRLGRKVD